MLILAFQVIFSPPPRFDFSRVRVAFFGLLAFTFGFSWWFFSGLKKRSWKKIEKFWSKIDFENEIEKFSKFLKTSRFSKNPEIFQFKSNYKKSKFSIFRKFLKKSKNLDFFENFRFLSISISKSIFDKKNQSFSMIFFKNR